MSLKNPESPVLDSMNSESAMQQRNEETIQYHDKITAICVLRAFEYLRNLDEEIVENHFALYDKLSEEVKKHDSLIVNDNDTIEDGKFSCSELLSFIKDQWKLQRKTEFTTENVIRELNLRIMVLDEFKKLEKYVERARWIVDYLNMKNSENRYLHMIHERVNNVIGSYNYHRDEKFNVVVILNINMNYVQNLEADELYLGFNDRITVDTQDLYLLFLRANFVYLFIDNEEMRHAFVNTCLLPLTIAQFNIPVLENGHYAKQTKIQNGILLFSTETHIQIAFEQFVTIEKIREKFKTLHGLLFEHDPRKMMQDNFNALLKYPAFSIYNIDFMKVFKKQWELSVLDQNVFFDIYRIEMPNLAENGFNTLMQIVDTEMQSHGNLNLKIIHRLHYNQFPFNKFLLTREEYDNKSIKEYIDLLAEQLFEDVQITSDIITPSNKWMLKRERIEHQKINDGIDERCQTCPLLSLCNNPDMSTCNVKQTTANVLKTLYLKLCR